MNQYEALLKALKLEREVYLRLAGAHLSTYDCSATIHKIIDALTRIENETTQTHQAQ